MPIFDNDGTTSTQISTLYDNNGSANVKISKVYDTDGTSEHLIYDDKGGLTVTSWGASNYASTTSASSAVFRPTSTVTIRITGCSIWGSAPSWANPHGNGSFWGSLSKNVNGASSGVSTGQVFTVGAGGYFSFSMSCGISGDPTNLYTIANWSISWSIT